MRIKLVKINIYKKLVRFGNIACGLYNVNLTIMLRQAAIFSFECFFKSFFKLYFFLYTVNYKKKKKIYHTKLMSSFEWGELESNFSELFLVPKRFRGFDMTINFD